MIFAAFQLNNFYKHIRLIRQGGERVTVGKSGNFLRLYILVSKDIENNIIRIEEMSGISMLAKFKPASHIKVEDIGCTECPSHVPKKYWTALQNALNA